MREIRRSLHRYPELAYQEERTGRRIVEELDRLGVKWRGGFASTGIVAEIGQGGDTPCVALRADMDALPITEETGVSFASTRPGVMHACGHDGHVAMLLGTAALLRDQELPGRVRLLFQPAEESGNGAARMIDDGALDGVDMIFGGHIDTHYPVGRFTVDQGLVCSYTDPFVIRIHGQGGHAARPHEAIDSVVVASNLVMSLQTLISRQIDPAQAAVITVGRFVAGTVHNVIAEHALLEGTIRSAHPGTRERILSGIRRVIQGFGEMCNASIELEFFGHLPAVINDETATAIARHAADRVVGTDNVISQGHPSLGGEDFAFYQQRIPGCLVRFGGACTTRETGPAHSSRFDFDEAVLGLGAAWLAEVARAGLHSLGS
ncbi:peptidase M20 [Desulfolithobacter dissulfuricans]|uniref:Peptidase M20 n=2 Tax=Desulfolithobacter dissulfuricans TaxID=2795293 RepID=A0A915U4Y5_9BACT|nr:peptidase M20 [Desulfolithobacter dissulfuricans]